MNRPNQRHVPVPNPQGPDPFPLVRTAPSFTSSPFLGRGARSKEGILPGPAEGKTAGLQTQSTLLTPFLFLPSDALEISLPHGNGLTVLMKLGPFALPVKPCYIITSRKYVTTLSIKSGERKEFFFTCPNPQNHFVIEIQKSIGKCIPVDCWRPASEARELRSGLKHC